MTDPAHSSPRTPRTAAGRALLDEFEPAAVVAGGSVEEYVAAIEAEAAALDVGRLAEALEALSRPHTNSSRWYYSGSVAHTDAQFAAAIAREYAALVDRHLREGEAAGGEGEAG